MLLLLLTMGRGAPIGLSLLIGRLILLLSLLMEGGVALLLLLLLTRERRRPGLRLVMILLPLVLVMALMVRPGRSRL